MPATEKQRLFAVALRAAARSLLGRDFIEGCSIIAAATCEAALELGMERLYFRMGHYVWPDGRAGVHAWAETADGLVIDLQRDPVVAWEARPEYRAIRGNVFAEGLGEAWMQWLPSLPALESIPGDRRVEVARMIARATVEVIEPPAPASTAGHLAESRELIRQLDRRLGHAHLSGAQWAEAQRAAGKSPRYFDERLPHWRERDDAA